MHDDITRLTAADFDETIAFLDLAFSRKEPSESFATVLPKLYQPDDGLMACNYAVRKDGRIRAIVGSFPMTMQVGEQELKTAGIGGVSTHPEERRHGYMRTLMEAVLADMEQDGCALSVLGGQRQRYGYNGYEKSGTLHAFYLSKTNLRHKDPDSALPEIRFTCIAVSTGSKVPMDPPLEPSKLEAAVASMCRWHRSQDAFVQRDPKDFLNILVSWNSSVWLGCAPDGQPVGYLVVFPNGTVVEFVPASPDWIMPIAAAWVRKQTENGVNFDIHPWQPEIVRELGNASETCQVRPAYNIRIIDWPRVLKALLQLKVRQTVLPEGRLRLSLSDLGKTVELTYRNGCVDCCYFDGPADIVLDSLTATRLLLGPLPADLVVPDICNRSPDLTSVLKT